MRFYFALQFTVLLGYISLTSGASVKFSEDEIVPAILSKFIGSSSRLELDKHRQNKTTYTGLAEAEALHEESSDELLKAQLFHEDQQSKLHNIPKAKQDAIIRQLWGGTCKLDDWIRCNNITTWGGDYFVNDKLEHFEMECTTFSWVCMRNGWSVNRCHLLCMSYCNRDLLVTRSYDRYVSHDGYCPPVSKAVLK